MENQTVAALIVRIKALALQFKTLRAAPISKPKKNEGAQEAAETVKAPDKEAKDLDKSAKAVIMSAIKQLKAQLDNEKAIYEKQLKESTDVLAAFNIDSNIFFDTIRNGKKVREEATGILTQIRTLITNYENTCRLRITHLFRSSISASADNINPPIDQLKALVKAHLFDNPSITLSRKLTAYELDNTYKHNEEAVITMVQNHFAKTAAAKQAFLSDTQTIVAELQEILEANKAKK